MSGGITTGFTEEGPWDPQKGYLQEGFGRAESLYKAGPAPYFPGRTLAGFDPAQQAAQAATMGYALGPRPAAQQAMAERQMGRTYDWARQMPQVGQTALQRQANLGNLMQTYGGQGVAETHPTYTDMMRGRVDTGAGTPYGDMAAAYKDQVIGQLTDPTSGVLPGIRSALVNYQPGGSSRGDMLQQSAIVDAVTKGMAMPMAQMYGQAYGQAQGARLPAAQAALAGRQQQLDAIRQRAQMEQAGFGQYMGGLQQGAQTGLAGMQQYPGIMAAPLSMYQAMGDVGAQRRALAQESINQAMQKYQYGAQAPQVALQNFMAGISGEYGGVQRQTPSALQSLGQIGSFMAGLGGGGG
tara:strand:+ start:813 stop:1871 length:1059 start_codon:yes stop_codon:yes gene_type:complete